MAYLRIDGCVNYVPCKRKTDEVVLAPEASVNIKKWVPWKEFAALPQTLQKVYVQTQVDTYRVGVGYLALAWGKSEPTVRAVLSPLGVRFPARTAKADKLRFMEFVQE